MDAADTPLALPSLRPARRLDLALGALDSLAAHLIDVVAWVVLGVALAAVVVSGAPGFVGLSTVRVMGGSMGRQAPIGSVAVLRPTDSSALRVGDVILFARHGASVATLHRVARLDQQADGRTMVVTRGDANHSDDPTPELLKGKGAVLVADVPLAGYVLSALELMSVRIALFGLAILKVVIPRHRRGASDDPDPMSRPISPPPDSSSA